LTLTGRKRGVSLIFGGIFGGISFLLPLKIKVFTVIY
jgi:hypothetical protein